MGEESPILNPMGGGFRWAWKRGWKHLDRFVVGAVVFGLAGILGSLLFRQPIVVWSVSVLVALAAAFGWAVLRAPYEQRDALRRDLGNLRNSVNEQEARRKRLLGDRELTNETFFVWELVKPDAKPLVVNRVFTDCHFHGPGMVAFIAHNKVINFSLGQGALDEVLHEMVGDGAKQGIIGFLSCDLTRCHFHGVGIYGSRAMLDEIRQQTVVV